MYNYPKTRDNISKTIKQGGKMMTFPNDFVWGTATSSIQIEGSPAGDGKGKNIWDAYSHHTDRIRENHNPDIACDHYNRYKEDVEIMKKIGVRAYRFSIDWSRVLPEGAVRLINKAFSFTLIL